MFGGFFGGFAYYGQVEAAADRLGDVAGGHAFFGDAMIAVRLCLAPWPAGKDGRCRAVREGQRLRPSPI